MDVVYFVHYFEQNGTQVRFLNENGQAVRPTDQEIVDCRVETIVETLARLFDNQRAAGVKSCYFGTTREGEQILHLESNPLLTERHCKLTFAPEVKFVPWKGPNTTEPIKGVTLWSDFQGQRSTATRSRERTMEILNRLFKEGHQPDTRLVSEAKPRTGTWWMAGAVIALLTAGVGAYYLWNRGRNA